MNLIRINCRHKCKCYLRYLTILLLFNHLFSRMLPVFSIYFIFTVNTLTSGFLSSFIFVIILTFFVLFKTRIKQLLLHRTRHLCLILRKRAISAHMNSFLFVCPLYAERMSITYSACKHKTFVCLLTLCWKSFYFQVFSLRIHYYRRSQSLFIYVRRIIFFLWVSENKQ